MGVAISGISERLEVVDVPIHVQRDEIPWVERRTGVGPDSLVAHESSDVVSVGSIDIELIHTPGHTPGSQCFVVDGRLVSGDTLFLEGCGRTDLPGADPEEQCEEQCEPCVGNGGDHRVGEAERRREALDKLEGELKDVSSHLSGGWAERISVVKRGGRVTFLVRFDDMEAMLVVSAALEQSRELFRLVLEEEGVGFQFWAYVGVEFYAPEPGPVKIRVMLDITGPVSTL